MSTTALRATRLPTDGPKRIGGFALAGLLGAGGMGAVYLGRSPVGQAVAVKIVHPHLAGSPRFRERFRREVAAASAVTGPYTAAVISADVDADLPWMATEYVDGPSLADAVADHGPLPVAAVWRLAQGIAQALVAIHRAGLVHRDLKPSNVVLGRDGVPRVIDFGIARRVGAPGRRRGGTMIGTPGFLPPEQVTSGVVGPSGDVFSLGALLCHALTGTHPYGQASPAALVRRAVRGGPDLSAVADPTLRRMLAACLSPDPTLRPSPARILAISRAALADVTADVTADVAADVAADGRVAILRRPSSAAGEPPTATYFPETFCGDAGWPATGWAS